MSLKEKRGPEPRINREIVLDKIRLIGANSEMIGITTVVATITLLPGELVRYARSLAATTLFGSNILFYAETGYFDAAARLKPLLHTWSLAVEEQFYILWPVMLSLVGVRWRNKLAAFIVAATLASFVASVAMVRTDMSAAYYLLPSRAWELGAGAIVACAPPCRLVSRLRNALAMAGLGLILIAINRFNDTTSFPGELALLPCTGAAVLIWTGAVGTWVASALAWRPLVFLGQISYSLYLWHWPVIVFSSIALFLPVTNMTITLQVLASFAIAVLSWRFIEQPLRHGTAGWSTRRVLGAGVLGMALLLAVAGALAWSGGLPQRFTASQRTIGAFEALDGDALYRKGTCFTVGADERFDAQRCLVPQGKLPILMLVGDSHAAHYWPGLSRYAAQVDILQATRTGCKPLLYPADHDRCHAFFRSILSGNIATHSPDRLVLAARWRMDDLPLLKQTLENATVRAAHPVVIGPVPQYTTALPRLLVFADRRNDATLVAASRDPEGIAVDRAMARLVGAAGVPYVSMIDTLCPAGVCQTLATPGHPMQFDYGHFTAEGSAVAVDRIASRVLPLPASSGRSR